MSLNNMNNFSGKPVKYRNGISVGIEAWKLAGKVYGSEKALCRFKQQCKCFFRLFINYKFASEWLGELQDPSFRTVMTHRSHIFIKPFRSYISRNWDKNKKSKVLLDSYRFIMNKNEKLMQVITSEKGIEIANFMLNDTLAGRVILKYDSKHNREGEMILAFQCDLINENIISAGLSFEEAADGTWICRIGCIQGHKVNDQNTSKVVQKLLHGLRPKQLIVILVQDFAREMGIKSIYGVGSTIQSFKGIRTINLPWKHHLQFDYDAIWLECGGKQIEDGWFELPLTPVRKSHEEIKTHKRALYRRRYSMCDTISAKVAETAKSLTKISENKSPATKSKITVTSETEKPNLQTETEIVQLSQ
jgi:uncharacterized protein